MNWWRTRSLKFRLTCLHGVANLCTMGLLAGIVFFMIGTKMRADLDQQLQQDFSIVQSGLEYDHGRVEWELSENEQEGNPPALISFSVWGTDGTPLMSYGHELAGLPAPSMESGAPPGFLSTGGEADRIRIHQGPARIDGRDVLLRVHRDQRPLDQTLAGLAGALLVLIPLAVVLAGIGGYLIASRSLAPVNELCHQARRISAHSLDERLSAPNPHDEIGRLAGVFNQTFARLENAFEEMKRFTSDASHELRTPLTSLRAVGEVALKEPGNPDSGQEAIASMLEEAERLNDLTVYLLELARSDYGQALDTAPVRTRAIVGEVIETLNPVAAERRLTLRADVGPDLTALADRSLLRQALLNIVHNAILISPPGKEIVVRSGSCDAGVFMEVVDQGPGIPEEHQERVFDRFYRVDKARSRASGGFGLGLSIARASIERMGGTITLHSKPGEGACFRIELPTVLNKSSE